MFSVNILNGPESQTNCSERNSIICADLNVGNQNDYLSGVSLLDDIHYTQNPPNDQVTTSHCFSSSNNYQVEWQFSAQAAISNLGEISEVTEGLVCQQQAKIPKIRKPITTYTREQVAILEEAYKMSPYLNSVVRTRLSKQVEVSELKIRTWFRNRRQKQRAQFKKSIANITKSNGLLDSNVQFLPYERSFGVVQIQIPNYNSTSANASTAYIPSASPDSGINSENEDTLMLKNGWVNLNKLTTESFLCGNEVENFFEVTEVNPVNHSSNLANFFSSFVPDLC